MSLPLKRTHDLVVYLEEARYDFPKENTKAWISRLQDLGLSDNPTIADFGCAAGELLYQLARKFPQAELYGFDVVPALLEKAKKWVPEGNFQQGSILDRNSAKEDSFDITSLFGVHSIFDEFETSFGNLIHWTKPGGRAYIFGNFNPAPVDVWVQYRLCEDPDHSRKEAGWNIFSMESIGKFLRSHPKVKSHAFIPFEMPIDLAPHATDPVRSYSLTLRGGNRIQTNGLCLVHHQFFLEIAC